MPGFGSMHHTPGGFTLTRAASWLIDWMRAVGLRRTHLVGHSMGGCVCLHLAAQHPEEVDCLVLIDPAGMPPGRSRFGNLWPLVKECLMSPALLPLLVTDALKAGPGTLWRAANELLSEDIRRDLHLITARTLIIWGEKDALVPPSLGRVLRQEIVGSRLLVIKRSRHVPMVDSPREVSHALHMFLAGRPVGE
ncbi:MAG: alpha/beta hydrolase [Chloroflexota bacterium]|nr:alpha/beta hydrolase [Chloroflexota bacterium]